MKFSRAGVLLAAVALSASIPASASAGVLTFDATNGFETGAVGSQPGEYHDGDTGWTGEVTIQSSGTDGVTTNPGFGGAQFAKITPGPDGSYQAGYQDGPFGHVGTQQAFPTSGDTFRVFVDIFAQAAAGASGSFWWSNGINDTSIADYASAYLTETGFVITPGATSWEFKAKTSGDTIDVDTGKWYTMEVIFDRSGTELAATHNLYEQGGGLLYSELIPDGSLGHNPLSSNAGGLRYSWFTVWDDDSVGALYIDNSGSGPVVPEPSSLALLTIGGGLVVARRWRRRRAA